MFIATPIDYFELVVNPESYSHTIENLFHLSFLVKDGLVRVFLNDNGIPVVEPIVATQGKKQTNKQQEKLSNQVNKGGIHFQIYVSSRMYSFYKMV